MASTDGPPPPSTRSQLTSVDRPPRFTPKLAFNSPKRSTMPAITRQTLEALPIAYATQSLGMHKMHTLEDKLVVMAETGCVADLPLAFSPSLDLTDILSICAYQGTSSSRSALRTS